jgi:predicted DNA-binding transcriptional regulator AlpA
MLDSVDPILVEKQVSAWLGLSLPSLQRMRSNGTGPRFVQLSERRIGYRKSDVETWLAARTTNRIGALASLERTSGRGMSQGSTSPHYTEFRERTGQAPRQGAQMKSAWKREPTGGLQVRASKTIDHALTASSGANAHGAAVPRLVSSGTVVLRGVTVALDTDVGQAFVIDCARNTEGLILDAEIMSKYGLSDRDWERLAGNKPLLQAVGEERERRIANGDAAREGAQRHFAKAPTVLGDILTDNLVSPRHRIEAAKELRQAAGNGPDAKPGTGEKFIITINLGGDEKLHFEKQVAPLASLSPDEGERDE